MSRKDKRFRRVMDADTISGIRFDDLRAMLRSCGFEERVRGSHHIFTRGDIAEILNLQPRPDGYAKQYQVVQVRDLFNRYRITPGGKR
ncbi:MAG: type II toxin-antitoxin system HicA family toxin [Gemmatimonadaceae bacterium]